MDQAGLIRIKKMMSRQICAVLVLTVFFCPGMGHADEFRPSTYDECITDSMKGVGSDVAARAIMSSCRNQFPEQVAPAATPEEIAPQREEISSAASRDLTPEELGKLTATALVFGDSYRMTFRNGNEHLTLTEVTIAVWDNSNPDERREYTQRVRIGPLASDSAKYAVVSESGGFDWASSYESDSKWIVTAAKGID
jgi:hypothetical protein